MNKLIAIVALGLIFSCKVSNQKDKAAPKNSEKEKIAFVTNRDGNSEIYIMDINGGWFLFLCI